MDHCNCGACCDTGTTHSAVCPTGWVEKIRAHALEHYNEDGWDYVVESFEDHDLLEDFGDAPDYEAALKKVLQHVKLLDSHRRDIRGTAW